MYFFRFKAYEVVYCRLNNNYDMEKSNNSVQSTTIINLSSGQNLTRYDDSNQNENIFTKLFAQNVSELFSNCDDTANSSFTLCNIRNHTGIHKVSFPPKDEFPNTDCSSTPLIDKLIVISHLLLAINSSANVIIYMLKGKHKLGFVFCRVNLTEC